MLDVGVGFFVDLVIVFVCVLIIVEFILGFVFWFVMFIWNNGLWIVVILFFW